MTNKEVSSDAELNHEAVDKLLVLCEEVMRATPAGAQRFIEPAPGVLLRAKSSQHHLVFGRRGSGKSSLLRKMASDLTVTRRPIAFVDMETFKGHSYPDVLISVLIKSLHEFKNWLKTAATAPATKTSFWRKLYNAIPTRPPFKKTKTNLLSAELESLIRVLEHQLTQPESSEKQTKETASNENSHALELVGGGSAPGVNLQTKAAVGGKSAGSTESHSKYISHKVEYLHQNILRFQRFFKELSTLSDGPSFLILDDLYHIRKTDQAKVIDYFHRVAKGNSLWVKVGTIKHRSQWYEHSDPPIGMKLGDDAKEINLDISLENFSTLRDFLRKILSNLMAETPPLSIKGLINPTAIDRLTIASGGVTRDFIGIFAASISQARNRDADHHRGQKIGAEDVNRATGEYAPLKEEEFKRDTDSERQILENALKALVDFCTEESKCNVFLIPQKLSGSVRESIDQLIDLRLIHPVKSRVTLKKGASGELFEAYMLDLSQYTAARKVHEFQIVDLSAANKDESIRKASLIYKGP
jgi:Cdc6-like AAA superfamily ATPase